MMKERRELIMLINTDILPFDMNGIVKSEAWHKATPEQRQKFVSAAVTFETVINETAKKYRAKKTLKGEFIACCLYDFFWDIFEAPIDNEVLDDELEHWYDLDDDSKTGLECFSEALLDHALHIKRDIKMLKETFHEDHDIIVKEATNEKTGQVDPKLLNDFSSEYFDCLY